MTDTDVSWREALINEIWDAMANDKTPHRVRETLRKAGEEITRLRSPRGDGELVAALRHALKLLEPFDDPELSLGLGSNALAPIRAALSKAEAESAEDRCKCGAMSEHDCHDLPSLRHCGGAESTSAPAPVSGERERPVRVTRNWSDAKLGNCDACGQRARIVDDGEGVMICAPCSDAGYLSDWQDYARNLEEKITALRTPHGLPGEEELANAIQDYTWTRIAIGTREAHVAFARKLAAHILSRLTPSAIGAELGRAHDFYQSQVSEMREMREWNFDIGSAPVDEPILAAIEFHSSGQPVTERFVCRINSHGEMVTERGESIGWDFTDVAYAWMPLPNATPPTAQEGK